MITFYQLIQKIETLQHHIDTDIKTFKTKVCADCIEHCAECCKYQDIAASPLEFLPFAYHAWKAGQLDFWAKRIENTSSNTCIFSNFKEGEWGCSIYPSRGVICRLFGFAAVSDKYGKPKPAVCRVMKQKTPELAEKIKQYAEKGGKIPLFANYYNQLECIDPNLSDEQVPINQAAYKALEIVGNHCLYKDL